MFIEFPDAGPTTYLFNAGGEELAKVGLEPIHAPKHMGGAEGWGIWAWGSMGKSREA